MSGDDLVAYMYFISGDDLLACIVWFLNLICCVRYFLYWLTYIYYTKYLEFIIVKHRSSKMTTSSSSS